MEDIADEMIGLEISSNDSTSFATSSKGSSGPSAGTSTGHDYNEVCRLVDKESQQVDTFRELVTGIFVVTSVIVGIGTYLILSTLEVKEFKRTMQLYTNFIEDASRWQETRIHETLQNLGTTVTAYTVESNSTWPFITIPFFDVDVVHALEITNTDSIAFSPLVSDADDVHSWESFVKDQLWFGKQQNVSRHIFGFDDDRSRRSSTELSRGPYAPIWQISSATDTIPIPKQVNYDILTQPIFSQLYNAMVETRNTVFSDVVDPFLIYGGRPGRPISLNQTNQQTDMELHSITFHPIFQFPSETSKLVGLLQVTFNWKKFIEILTPPGSDLLLVLKNTCGKAYTYRNSKTSVGYIGQGDIHVEYLTNFWNAVDLFHADNWDTLLGDNRQCAYQVWVRPTPELLSFYRTWIPLVFSLGVAFSFFLLAFSFFVYDKYVKQRNDKVVRTAARSNAILSSLFPESIRDRLFENYASNNSERQGSNRGSNPSTSFTVTGRLKSFLSDGHSVATDDESNTQGFDSSKPIADLFPHATVLFADIVGFTAWSSVREPSQVFTLLETIYHTFDKIAKNRRVFKVETVGDCYMAVTGLPEPRKDHAVVMARFAFECMRKMNDVSRKLEITLGPDTGDLMMRFGLHSGPVTAGVLRGKKSRFQLFGDTVNTASRMESTGDKGRIHISQETATLLEAGGKSHWFTQREDKIVAKGKGEMTTYWLDIRDEETSTVCSKSSRSSGLVSGTGDDDGTKSVDSRGETPIGRKRKSFPSAKMKVADGKTSRLIDWNVEVITRLLKQIVARRNALQYKSDPVITDGDSVDSRSYTGSSSAGENLTILEEVQEIITLPKFDSKAARHQEDPESIELDANVIEQLRSYVATIASLYRDNPFHNFEHASHVTMSVVKLLSRIVAPNDMVEYDVDPCKVSSERKLKKELAYRMHDHTYGITSDPLTQFACVFSALIHDVEHSGVPNAQLIKENAAIATHYKNRSVAEQNSFDVSWAILMEPFYSDLCNVIFANETERIRFRQLVVNSVMATDIVDKELKELRNGRWDKAFKEALEDEDTTVAKNRKATIVIEHLIQASDVSHTMQHWHIFRKWNERLFQEMYKAYVEDRAEKDPSEFWYNGEIGFFDFYIIPLAKKLDSCGVFGVSSDEYLNYAMKNREEWVQRGKEIVEQMAADEIQKYEQTCVPNGRKTRSLRKL